MEAIRSLRELPGLAESRNFIVPWDDIEADLGTALPGDYREYVGYFGPGRWSGYLNVLIPDIEAAGSELRYQHRSLNALLQEKPDLRAGLSHSVYPEPGGLLRWGGTSGGELLHWRTGGQDPDQWPVVVVGSDAPEEIQEFDGSMSEFMSELFAGRLSIPFMSAGPTLDEIEFKGLTGKASRPRFAIPAVSHFAE
ncbi:hypothetical protein P3T35_007326 [Kitasatospora sp. GP30]|uniref:SMI1/KNR4 family protein n=1 Tax=Kitasatospora sp. GP30 TaxID=3035084 RepID=UPI000C709F5F|nr:SMI1/KNR4 family protein [Kitasatospora sp. GP30]MDH6145271.1 hypothetical protein [Kitasatospora sp. GP30]